MLNVKISHIYCNLEDCNKTEKIKLQKACNQSHYTVIITINILIMYLHINTCCICLNFLLHYLGQWFSKRDP